MPRPKQKRSSPTFSANPVSLDEQTKAKLLTLLGHPEFDPSSPEFDPMAETMRHQFLGYRVLKAGGSAPTLLERDPNASTTSPTRDVHLAILDVEATLGLGVDGAPHLDNIPRPADYREAFRPVSRAASNLLKTLQDWSAYYRDQFRLKGADIGAIEGALASLTEVSAAVVKDFASKSSKGARRNVALTEVIRRLRDIFREHCQVPRDSRKRQGAFESLSEWERGELEFVETALRAARIIPERYRELTRLFRDPRCTPKSM